MELARPFEPFSRRMTWAEICAAYPNQWVVLGELDHDPVTLVIHTAVVIGCGATRRESSASANMRDGELTARLYTGRLRSPRPW